MMLEDLAKEDRFRAEKLSYFRLELYKLYATRTEPSNQKVEKPVESVEFHTKKGFETRLLNFIHRVFNMWKKSSSFTEGIPQFC